MDITGVVLAGGENRRFGGKSKTDILINGKTILVRIFETLGEIFDDIIIVTKNSGNLRESGDYRIVKDILAKAGPLGGLYSGIKASAKEAVFVVGCDMPFLNRQLISKQIDLFLDNKCDAVIPLFNGNPEPLHSVYAVSILPVIERILDKNTDYSMMNFISLIRVNYLKVENSSGEAKSFININSPSDLEKIRYLHNR